MRGAEGLRIKTGVQRMLDAAVRECEAALVREALGRAELADRDRVVPFADGGDAGMRDGVHYTICARCGVIPVSGFEGPIVALIWHWRNRHGSVPEAVTF